MSTVTVGSVKMTYQAAVVFFPIAAIAAIALLKVPDSQAALAVASVVVMAAIQAYGVNCMSTGGCHKYAWVVALLMAVPIVLGVAALFLMDAKMNVKADDSSSTAVSAA